MYYIVKQRVEYVDRLKGLAILFVIVGHLSLWTLEQLGNPVPGFLGSFHMQLFMFLSGIVIAKVPDATKLCRKLQRFWMPLLTVGVMLTLMTGKGVIEYFEDRMKFGYWYVWTLGEFYILLFFTKKNAYNRTKKGIIIDLIILLGFTFIFQVCMFFLPKILLDTLGILLMRTYWVFFYGGFLFRKYGILTRLMSKNWLFSLCLFMGVPLTYLATKDYHWGFISSFFMVFVLVFLFREREEKNTLVERELSRLGKRSLDVYLFHYFFIVPVGGYELRELGVWFTSTQNYFIQFLLTLFIAVVTAYCCVLIGYVLRRSNLLNALVYGQFDALRKHNSVSHLH